MQNQLLLLLYPHGTFYRSQFLCASRGKSYGSPPGFPLDSELPLGKGFLMFTPRLPKFSTMAPVHLTVKTNTKVFNIVQKVRQLCTCPRNNIFISVSEDINPVQPHPQRLVEKFEGLISQLPGVAQKALWKVMQPRTIGEGLWLSVPNGPD